MPASSCNQITSSPLQLAVLRLTLRLRRLRVAFRSWSAAAVLAIVSLAASERCLMDAHWLVVSGMMRLEYVGMVAKCLVD